MTTPIASTHGCLYIPGTGRLVNSRMGTSGDVRVTDLGASSRGMTKASDMRRGDWTT